MTSEKSQSRAKRPIVYSISQEQCVWAAAGVIKPTLCINAFDCMSCPLDHKIQSDIAEGRFSDTKGRLVDGWDDPDRYLRVSFNQRKCRHMLTGRVAVKYCAHNYNCADCAFDQLIEDEDLGVSDDLVNVGYAGGFALAGNYYYHRGHSWARVEYGGRVRVGLDDFALRLVGPVDEFRLPKLGSVIEQNEPEIGLTRGDLRAEARIPVAGMVVAVNPGVVEKARTANQDPYNDGWLMMVEPEKLKGSLRNLLFGEECQAWMEEESSRLSGLVSKETGHSLAATGGRVVDDIYGSVPDLDWKMLMREFLLT